MKIDNQKPLATYAKATQDGKAMLRDSKPSWKVITALLGIIIFVVGSISVVLITRQQDTTPIAPTAPQSQPAAYIEKTQTCTLTFNVGKDEEEPITCGQTGCQTDDDCRQMDGGSTAFTCIEASNGNKYCSDERYEDACASNPSFANCCEPQEEEENLACGEVGCNTDNDCEGDLVCVTADNDRKYCADDRYEDACIDDPSEESCCEAPITTTTATATVTTKVTATATATTTPRVTTVITTVGCNDTCSANAECSNVSHICYEGRCRLDVNPTDAQCRLPSGETTISRPAVVPTESGPADWINYVKAGLGVLGIGALLLLLL